MLRMVEVLQRLIWLWVLSTIAGMGVICHFYWCWLLHPVVVEANNRNAVTSVNNVYINAAKANGYKVGSTLPKSSCNFHSTFHEKKSIEYSVSDITPGKSQAHLTFMLLKKHTYTHTHAGKEKTPASFSRGNIVNGKHHPLIYTFLFEKPSNKIHTENEKSNIIFLWEDSIVKYGHYEKTQKIIT